ncbi:MAG: P-loop NTPase [Candidatus Brocadiales bacterium]
MAKKKVAKKKTKRTGHSKVTVGLVIDDENILQQVNEALSEKSSPEEGGNNSRVKVLGQWKDLNVGFNMLKEYKPTISIIGLCSKENTSVHTLAERVSISLPETHIFMIGTDKDPEVMIKAMRAGTKEFLTAPLDSAELLNSVERIKTSLERREDGLSPRFIGVASVKGGSGATTLAVNLAVALRRVTHKRVLLMDACCHGGGGDVALFLNLKYSYSLRDVFENIDRLDSALLEGYMVEHSSGLRVIPGMEIADFVHEGCSINVEALRFLFNFLSTEFDYTIVDIGYAFARETLEILKLLDSTLLVMPIASLPSVRNAKQGLEVLGELDLLENTKLVLNRYDSFTKGASFIAIDDIVKTLSTPIFCTIPNDWMLVTECTNLGSAVVTEKRNSPIAQRFLSLAEHLSKAEVPK